MEGTASEFCRRAHRRTGRNRAGCHRRCVVAMRRQWLPNRTFYRLSSADSGRRNRPAGPPRLSRPAFAEWYAASRPARWRAPRARDSPSHNRADAMGDDATPPCRGSISEEPRHLELKHREKSHFPLWQTSSRSHLHEEWLHPNRVLSWRCPCHLGWSLLSSRDEVRAAVELVYDSKIFSWISVAQSDQRRFALSR